MSNTIESGTHKGRVSSYKPEMSAKQKRNRKTVIATKPDGTTIKCEHKTFRALNKHYIKSGILNRF